MANFKVADLKLADKGRLRIEWAESRMPVLMALRDKFKHDKPFRGHKIAGCLHVTKETAVLVRTLRAAGAEVSWSGCNPLSTQDDIAAALAAEDTSIFAWHGLSKDEFYWCIERTLDFHAHPHARRRRRPHLHGAQRSTRRPGLAHRRWHRGDHHRRASPARHGQADGKLLYPVIAINDCETKWDFDNVYGTGQSSLDGILRASSVLLAGKTFVVAGYRALRQAAWRCGPRGMGANVVVTEIKPTAALKATLEGFRVMPMDEAAKIGDIFITATGMKDVHRRPSRRLVQGRRAYLQHRPLRLRDQPRRRSRRAAKGNRREVREQQRGVHARSRTAAACTCIGQGRLVNLAAAEGHPSEVMDMSFANQFLGLVKLARDGKHHEQTRSTSCRPSRIRRSPTPSSRRWVSTSTPSPTSRRATRPITRRHLISVASLTVVTHLGTAGSHLPSGRADALLQQRPRVLPALYVL